MQIQLGEQVLTRDGVAVAIVDRVILNAETRNVAAVVLRKGSFFPHDVEVQLDQFTEDNSGHHRLVFSAAELEHLPRFVEGDYTTPPPELDLPFNYDRQMVLWPSGSVGPLMSSEAASLPNTPPLDEETVARIYEHDAENAVIVEGSAIISSDGHKVGALERLTFDEHTGHLVSVIVRQGLFFPANHRLSGNLVSGARDGALYLNVDRAKIEELTRTRASMRDVE